LMIRRDEDGFTQREGAVQLGGVSDIISKSLIIFTVEDLERVFIDKYDFIGLDCKIKFLTDQLNYIRNYLINPEFKNLWDNMSGILLLLLKNEKELNNYSDNFLNCYSNLFDDNGEGRDLYTSMLGLLEEQINNDSKLYSFMDGLTDFHGFNTLNYGRFFRMKIFSEIDQSFIAFLEDKENEGIITKEKRDTIQSLYGKLIHLHKEFVRE
ncbi:hypothetical protein OAT16_06805, partial [Prolixibacteraceae bacterium]|nr:hypothetical protein [Prolixibacteraceae bacterium]